MPMSVAAKLKLGFYPDLQFIKFIDKKINMRFKRLHRKRKVFFV